MVVITIKTNRDNKIIIENYSMIDYLSELKIQNNNITYYKYNFNNMLCFSFGYYYNEKCNYYKRFRVGDDKSLSYYIIYKNGVLKIRDLNIKIIIYNIIFYSYFICNKYYTFGNTKIYNFSTSFSNKKLFNYCDFYKIHSYI